MKKIKKFLFLTTSILLPSLFLVSCIKKEKTDNNNDLIKKPTGSSLKIIEKPSLSYKDLRSTSAILELKSSSPLNLGVVNLFSKEVDKKMYPKTPFASFEIKETTSYITFLLNNLLQNKTYDVKVEYIQQDKKEEIESKNIFTTPPPEIIKTAEQQIGEFFNLNLDKYLKIRAKNNFDISNVKAENMLKNLQMQQKLEVYYENIPEEIKKQMNQKQLNLNNIQLKMQYYKAKIKEDDSSTIIVPLVIESKEQNQFSKYRRLVKMREIKLELSRFKEDDKKVSQYAKLSQFMDNMPPSISLKEGVESAKLIQKFEQDSFVGNFETVQDKRKKIVEKYFNLVNLKNQANKIDYWVEDIQLDPLNPLNIIINLRITHKDTSKYISKPLIFNVKNNSVAYNYQNLKYWAKEMAHIYLLGYKNIYNYNFNNAKQNEIAINSPNENIVNYTIEQISLTPNVSQSLDVSVTAHFKDGSASYAFIKTFGVPKRAYIFPKEFQDSSEKYRMIVDELDRENLSKVTNSAAQRVDATILGGGYLEQRGIYSGKSLSKQFHMGEDYLAPAGTALLAPFNGKIVAAYDLPTKGIGDGVGASIIMEVAKKDLVGVLDQKIINKNFRYTDTIAITFMHLDPSYLKNLGTIAVASASGREMAYVSEITPFSPKYVSKGEQIGVIGTTANNGGWVPHVHSEVFNGNAYQYDVHGNKLKEFTNGYHSNWTRARRYDPSKANFNPSSIKAIGVSVTSNAKIYKVDPITLEPTKEQIQKNNLPLVDRNYYISKNNDEAKRGLINPNILFSIVDKESLAFYIEDIFPELNKRSN